MEKFVYWLNEGIEECRTGVKSETEDSPSGCYGNPILLAGKAHERLVSLHPFSDGNGRASRSVIQMICQKFDLPPFTGDGDDPMFFQNACFGRVGEYPEKVKMGYVIDYVPNPDRHIQFMLAGFNNTISIVKK